MLKRLKKYLRQALSPIFPSLKSKPKKAKKKAGDKGHQKAQSVAQPSLAQPAVTQPIAVPELKAKKKVDKERRHKHAPPSFPFHPIDPPLAWKSVEHMEGDDVPALEIRGCPLGRLHAVHARKETLDGVLKLFEQISWHNSVLSLGDRSPSFASSTDMLAFDANVCFELADIWFADHETLRLRMLPRRREEATFQIIRCYQRDPACENGVRQLTEQPAASETATFVDVKLANPYLPLLISVCGQGGELIELVILPFPSLCRGGSHYGELLATTGREKSSLGALQDISSKLLQSARSRQSGARVAELKIDLRHATGTERIFAPDLLFWLTNVLGLKLAVSHFPSTANETVRNYLLASLGIEPGNLTGVLADGGKALRLPVDAIPSVQALMSDWTLDGAVIESGFVLASIHDNMPKWLFRPPARLCAAARSMAPAALFPEFEPLDSSTSDTESIEAKTEVSAIRFCRFGVIDEVSLVYPTMPTNAAKSIGSAAAPKAAALPATTVLLNASSSADMAIACLEAVALQLGAQNLKVLVAGRPADGQFMEEHLKRLFQAAAQFVLAEESESDGAVLNRLAGMADSELLLMLTVPVLLHDRRSIAQLASLMVSAEVASASCVLIGLRDPNEKSVKPAPVFAGRFGEVGADGKISSITSNMEEILPQLPPSTWPVASSSSRLLMARTADWRKFGGFDEASPNMSTKFWANMIAAGRFHLLTTTFTAGLQSVEGADTFSAAVDCFPDLHQVEKVSVQIRRLVA